jgi:hypothetical protein
MNYKKCTTGWVEQMFDEQGNLLKQEFVADNQLCDYETELGHKVPLEHDARNFYYPFNMVQP